MVQASASKKLFGFILAFWKKFSASNPSICVSNGRVRGGKTGSVNLSSRANLGMTGEIEPGVALVENSSSFCLSPDHGEVVE